MDFSTSGNPTGPSARIRRLTPPSSFDVFLEGSSSNGLALDNDGALIACNHGVQSLVRIDPSTKTPTPLALTYEGDHFNSPNDVTVRSDGTFYFTDPDWQLGPRTAETGMTGAYRVVGESDVSLVIGSLDKPNGIALSPDERTLYVGSAGSDVLAFELDGNGVVGSSRVFASPGGSDGMGVDCAGNLYVTGGGEVKVYAPDGGQLGAIAVAMSPSNVAFGGADRRTLYITAGAGLYSIVLNVPGLPY
jgi:gluconolactonase